MCLADLFPWWGTVGSVVQPMSQWDQLFAVLRCPSIFWCHCGWVMASASCSQWFQGVPFARSLPYPQVHSGTLWILTSAWWEPCWEVLYLFWRISVSGKAALKAFLLLKSALLSSMSSERYGPSFPGTEGVPCVWDLQVLGQLC